MSFKVYSRKTCAYCQMVKKIFNGEGIPYEEVNLDDEPQSVTDRVVEMSGMTTVPVVTSYDNGAETIVSVGWKPKDLLSAIKDYQSR